MKTIAASLLALGLLAGAANAHSAKVFGDLQKSAPRSDINQIDGSAQRSDGPFGKLQNSAP